MHRSQLIVGARVTNCASDRNELVADFAAIPPFSARPATVLADSPTAMPTATRSRRLPRATLRLWWRPGSGRRRRYDFRPAKARCGEETQGRMAQSHGRQARQRGRPCRCTGCASRPSSRSSASSRRPSASPAPFSSCAASTRWPVSGIAVLQLQAPAQAQAGEGLGGRCWPDRSMRKLDHGPAAPKIARPSIHPNPSSRFRRTSIAPPTDDSQITQHRIPTLKSDRLLGQYSRDDLWMVAADVLRSPVRDVSLDGAYISCLYHLIPDKNALLRAVYDVLKPGSYFIVITLSEQHLRNRF